MTKRFGFIVFFLIIAATLSPVLSQVKATSTDDFHTIYRFVDPKGDVKSDAPAYVDILSLEIRENVNQLQFVWEGNGPLENNNKQYYFLVFDTDLNPMTGQNWGGAGGELKIGIYQTASLVYFDAPGNVIQEVKNYPVTYTGNKLILTISKQSVNADKFIFYFETSGDTPYVDTGVLKLIKLYPKVDSGSVSNERCDVGSDQKSQFHVRWSDDGLDASNLTVKVNNISYTTDANGLITITDRSDDVIRKTWKVTDIIDYPKYNVTASEQSIIWDKVKISVEEDNRVNLGSTSINWVGSYLYDGQAFKGTVSLNDTMNKFSPGKYSFRVASISDALYGLKKFDANTFNAILDRVNITLSVAQTRIDVGAKPEVAISPKYAYDGQVFSGQVSLDDMQTNQIGEYSVKTRSITDPLYGLTLFKSNEPNYIVDRVKITDCGASATSADVKQQVTVWVKAEYEYDGESFDGLNGKLFVNNDELTWSAKQLRWERNYTQTDPKSISFKVSSVQDKKYGLKQFSDATSGVLVEWKQTGISGFPPASIIVGACLAVAVLIIARKHITSASS